MQGLREAALDLDGCGAAVAAADSRPAERPALVHDHGQLRIRRSGQGDADRRRGGARFGNQRALATHRELFAAALCRLGIPVAEPGPNGRRSACCGTRLQITILAVRQVFARAWEVGPAGAPFSRFVLIRWESRDVRYRAIIPTALDSVDCQLALTNEQEQPA